MIPFGEAKLEQLYPAHEIYVDRVTALTDAVLKERLVLPGDAEKMKKSAQEADVP